jgi:hypothetical protein
MDARPFRVLWQTSHRHRSIPAVYSSSRAASYLPYLLSLAIKMGSFCSLRNRYPTRANPGPDTFSGAGSPSRFRV